MTGVLGRHAATPCAKCMQNAGKAIRARPGLEWMTAEHAVGRIFHAERTTPSKQPISADRRGTNPLEPSASLAHRASPEAILSQKFVLQARSTSCLLHSKPVPGARRLLLLSSWRRSIGGRQTLRSCSGPRRKPRAPGHRPGTRTRCKRQRAFQSCSALRDCQAPHIHQFTCDAICRFVPRCPIFISMTRLILRGTRTLALFPPRCHQHGTLGRMLSDAKITPVDRKADQYPNYSRRRYAHMSCTHEKDRQCRDAP